MSFVERAHRRHEPDRPGTGKLPAHVWDCPQGLHFAVASASTSYRGSSSGLAARIARRCASTVSQSPRSMGPVSSKPLSIVLRISGTSTFGRRTRGAKELGRHRMQRDEVVRCDRGACVVERTGIVGELERLQAEGLRQPVPRGPRLFPFRSDSRPGSVELLGSSRTRERLERVHREAASMRIECRQRRGSGDVRDPWAFLEPSRHLGDRAVRHAEEDELAVVAHGDAALAQASRNGRADAAGTDDFDALEHSKLQFRSGYRALEAYTGNASLACLVGRRFLLGLAVALACLAPGQARAAIPLAACSSTSDGALCGTVTVPIDRTGVFPGTIGLHVEVLPATGLPRGTMFLIAGGPGQGSAGAFDLGPGFNRELMQFMFPGYTLVAFDNRGTGQSGVLRCPGLQGVTVATAEQEAAHARDCADQIGPARVFYATRDHAEDIEAVRRALGLGRIGLYGVSYGTKLAMAYALAHPEGVERLLLDSVVVPTFPEPFDQNVLHEMPRTLTSFCAGGVCSAATGNFGANVVKLANRLEARPIKGKVIMASGKVRTLRMTGEDLISMIVDVDLSPGLAAEAPAAVYAALAGNNRPLLRLFDLDLRVERVRSRGPQLRPVRGDELL